MDLPVSTIESARQPDNLGFGNRLRLGSGYIDGAKFHLLQRSLPVRYPDDKKAQYGSPR